MGLASPNTKSLVPKFAGIGELGHTNAAVLRTASFAARTASFAADRLQPQLSELVHRLAVGLSA